MGEKYEILGWDRKTGEYQGQQYDNYVFYCASLSDRPKSGVGQITAQVKVKTAVAELCGFEPGSDVIGDQLTVAYNKFGAVAAIEIVKL